jgi:hypothetical protein
VFYKPDTYHGGTHRKMITAETRRRGEENKIVIHTDQDGGVGAQRKLIHEALTEQIIGAAMEVHKALGPGLLESVYEECLCHELHLEVCGFSDKSPYQSSTKAFPLTVVIALI